VAYTTCLFAVPAPSDAAAAEAAARLDRLRAYFAVWSTPVLHRVDAPGVVAGCLTFGDGDGDPACVWGTLRRGRLVGPGAALRAEGRGIEWVVADTDVTSTYRCRDALSTHAVVAALLGAGVVEVRAQSLVELLAFEHPANDEHVVAGVEIVGAGAVLAVTGSGVEVVERAPARWELVPEEEAHGQAVDRLRDTLTDADGKRVGLGLTAGIDSRVLAVALRDSAPLTYTWGTPAAPDCVGAAHVAGALGLPHRVVEPEQLGDEEVVAAGRASATWTEGCAPLGVVRGERSLGVGVNVTGAGGELGRAFHYAYLARNRREPAVEELRALWRPQAGLEGLADRAAVERVAGAAASAIDRAAASGVTGWRILDVVYAEQRMRRWARSGIAPTAGAAWLAPFLAPRVAAALVSLPLGERVTDGFHRRYLAERAPDLVPPVPQRQRRFVPAAARRAAAAWRARRAQAGPAASASPFATAYPQTFTYLHEEVCAHPLVAEALGADHAARLAERVRRAEAGAVQAALTLAGPVLLSEATAALSRT
jgi:hypothetical protein